MTARNRFLMKAFKLRFDILKNFTTSSDTACSWFSIFLVVKKNIRADPVSCRRCHFQITATSELNRCWNWKFRKKTFCRCSCWQTVFCNNREIFKGCKTLTDVVTECLWWYLPTSDNESKYSLFSVFPTSRSAQHSPVFDFRCLATYPAIWSHFLGVSIKNQRAWIDVQYLIVDNWDHFFSQIFISGQ